jgi:hypothetical protein
VANLLDSLPGILSEEDEGVAEALRRDARITVDIYSDKNGIVGRRVGWYF